MNEESLKQRIRVLLEEIQTEADPVLLNRYRAIFRREVSFFHRSYMAAYLLLLAEGGAQPVKRKPETTAGPKQQEKRIRSPGRQDRKGKEGINRTDQKDISSPLGEAESVRLFISIGRNRKVFPREILALVDAKARVSRDDIGTIRILDNYSFVQVRTGAADTVIQALNGQHFRGRTLTVNYARGRREGEEETPDPGNTAWADSAGFSGYDD
ncbi:MAG: DbpA RNA binding domain-containing protein [Spirochaetaceae bacterium]|jgi:hypothetical protein|nr:DbpA RNA binding domain-containing protein [Spirochaetaceae bacterium]